jgi:small conductance mechanosensitive channel
MFSTTITSEMVNEFIAKALNAGIDLGGRILAALIIFIIGKFLINWANKLFATMLQKRKVDASIQSFLKSIVNITLLVMLFLAVIGKLGIELTSFAALLASVGVAVGMALSGNLSNFAGGVIILVFRPYKVGDYIEASTGASGTVTDIQIFHTVLTTPDNKVIFAPNGAMSSAVVTNYSRKETRRLDFTFGVEYGTDFQQARTILMEIINQDTRILKDPTPFVEVGALADSSVNITVRVWVNASDYWAVNFDMKKNVYATFNEKGISFPFPQLTVHQV